MQTPRFFRPVLRCLVAGLAGVLLSQCAAERAPIGGPPDETPPVLLFTAPEPLTTNFAGDRLYFYFDEYLKPGLAKADVFISPLLPSSAYELQLVNRRIRLTFLQPLADSTTYVVVLKKGIADHTAGNALAEPLIFAFSTGPTVDSALVRGRVTDAQTGLGVKDFTVLLYATDSVPDSLFTNRAPVYAAVTDAEGNYDLPFLRPRSYFIIGTDDANRDYRYGLASEALALPDTLLINLTPDSLRATRNLRAFRPDTTPPTLAGLRWLSDRLVALEFNEPARSARVLWTGAPAPDTLTQAAPDNPKRLLYFLPQAAPDTFRLVITHATDTLGNALDTTLMVNRPNRVLRDSILTFKPLELENQPLSRRLLLNAPLPPDTALWARYIQLLDTGNVPQPTRLEPVGLTLTFTLMGTPDTTQPYTLVIDSALASVHNIRPDSTLRLPVNFRGLSQYARVAGTYTAPADAPALIVYLYNVETKKRIRLPGTPFRLPYVPAGTYRPLVVADANADGEWTPGNARPLRQAERSLLLPQEIKVRAGWEFEDLVIEIPSF